MKCVLHRQSEGVVDSEGGAEGYLVRLEEQWGVRKLSVEASYTLTARILDQGDIKQFPGSLEIWESGHKYLHYKCQCAESK